MTKRTDAGVDPRIKRLVGLLTEETSGYPRTAARLRVARQLFHECVAEQLSGALNAHLQQLPQETLQHKQELSRWLNAELRSLGLAIRCPKTGQPAILHVNRGSGSQHGRFQLELTGRDHARQRTLTSIELFPLELTSASPRIEPLSENWASRTSRPPENRSR